MDDSFDRILEGLPPRRSRSRLEPYGKLIDGLLRRGRTYREIASVLVKNYELHASISTIHDYVRRWGQAARKSRKGQASGRTSGEDAILNDRKVRADAERSQAGDDEIQQRIDALKRKPIADQTQPELFHYDPNEPLRIPPKTGSRKPGD